MSELTGKSRGPAADAVKARAALLRSMTPTRMLDYGMDHWDATQLAGAPATQAWDDTAAALAEAQLARATAAAGHGNIETAVNCYRWAAAALVAAQMAHNYDNAAKRTLYGRLSRAYQDAARLDTELCIERLAIPHRSSHCNAWFVRPRTDRPAPTVIIVGGQSGWGPAYHRQATALARRGLSAVLLEAPGQGETRMFHGLYLDAHAHEAFSATLDAVHERTGFGGPAGVWGNSFGGLIAARAALHDNRFGACCVNGAPSRPEPAPFRTAGEQSQALLGVGSDEEVAAIFRTLWIDPAVDRTAAAVLVLHGEADPLITLDQQRAFLDLSADSSLRVWEDGEHTIYNHSAERTDFVADWFRHQLNRG
ncbi:alpha/beta hydrolase family protein [Nocardia carnea]|uniref:alpha/beta hydrolase family protein n=1 Tax=Nocardia carnea TaxID=37328 RepID=UPI00245696C9|nr:alpha/beta fold hydrolase [Nocardia carnea]